MLQVVQTSRVANAKSVIAGPLNLTTYGLSVFKGQLGFALHRKYDNIRDWRLPKVWKGAKSISCSHSDQ